jgi:hypothetical protein
MEIKKLVEMKNALAEVEINIKNATVIKLSIFLATPSRVR